MDTTSGGSGRGRRSKVARLIEEYDLGAIGDELERAWTADGDRRRSLRDLADRFNRELLERVLRDAGVSSLDGEVENTYRLLTAESVSGADRTRIQRHLEREGIDVDALLEEFVSYQSIRTYLRKHRGVEHAREETDRVESADRTIQQLRNRLAAVAEQRIDQLDRNDELDAGSVGVMVDVRAVCADCGSQYPVGGLLDRGGCDCA
jgi:hypothetical protein